MIYRHVFFSFVSLLALPSPFALYTLRTDICFFLSFFKLLRDYVLQSLQVDYM